MVTGLEGLGLRGCNIGEIEEMIDLYEIRGLPRDEAKEVVETMAKYRGECRVLGV